jgi:hypothetical protein
VDFLYFVAKNDGSHFFSRTLEQHNQAVRLYQGGSRVTPTKPSPTPAAGAGMGDDRAARVEES